METKIEKKFYVISKNDGKKLHFYPLPGQIDTDGKPINISLRVQTNTDGRVLRSSKPSFTLFELSNGKFIYNKKSKLGYYVATGCDVKEMAITDLPSNYSINHITPTKIEIVFDGGEIGTYETSEFREIRPSSIKSATFTTTPESKPEEVKAKVEEVKEEPKPGEWIDEIIKVAPIPTSTIDGFFVKANDWRLLLRNVKRQVNTLITGPAGTGKTSIVKKVADKLGLPIYTFDMGAMIDPISSLLGVHRLQDGKSIFDYATFTQVIQKPCIILLDELSRAPMGVGNILFPCLDDRRTLPVEIAGGTDIRSIPIHPEVTFIATANIGAEYTGTNTLDRALTSRFFPLELKYLPNKEEENVLIKRTGVTSKDANLIVKVANTIRTMNSKLELSTSVSIRETLMVSQLVMDGWTMGDAMKTVYLPMFEGNNDSDGERGKVLKVLSSY